MAFGMLFICLVAFSLSVCSAASIKERQAEEIPFVPLTDIVAESAANSSNVVRRQADAGAVETFPAVPTLAYQTYRTCNYIILVVIDFTAGGGGRPMFDGGAIFYQAYLSGNAAAAPDFLEGIQVIPGIGPNFPTFITPWLGPFPECSNLVLNVTIGNSVGTASRFASFHRQLACNCDTGVVSGDPHVLTFDNGKADLNGPCTYILAKDCEHEIPRWMVTVTNGELVGKTKKRRIASGHVHMYGHIIDLFEDGSIQSDGADLWNHFGDVALTIDLLIAILRAPGTVGIVVPIDDETFIELGTNHLMKVGLKRAYWKGRVCGIFGNDNDNPDDDFLVRGKKDIDLFETNWQVPGSCRNETK